MCCACWVQSFSINYCTWALKCYIKTKPRNLIVPFLVMMIRREFRELFRHRQRCGDHCYCKTLGCWAEVGVQHDGRGHRWNKRGKHSGITFLAWFMNYCELLEKVAESVPWIGHPFSPLFMGIISKPPMEGTIKKQVYLHLPTLYWQNTCWAASFVHTSSIWNRRMHGMFGTRNP